MMADGIFTPAVSVTSAVVGIAIAKPSVNNDVIPISIVSAQGFPRLLLTRILGIPYWYIPPPASRNVAHIVLVRTKYVPITT